MRMKYEKSCGAIIFSEGQGDYEFLLIKHCNDGHWGFPKGHVDEGETEHQTALREIYEETGLSVELFEGFRGEEHYAPKPKVSKIVVYFLAKSTSQDVTYIFPEIETHAWLNIHEACEQLTFEGSKQQLRRAYDYLMTHHKM